MVNMVDFHTHILPAIDDGAKTVEDSLFILESLSNAGISSVVLSPHYYPDKENISTFSINRADSFKKLSVAINESDIKVPKLHLATEVYLEPILMNNDDLTELTLDLKGEFMLTELLYEETLSSTSRSTLQQLIYSYNITPILAHIDRYPFLMKEKNLYDLLELGCVAQMNIYSLTDFWKRQKLLKYLKKGYIGVIGSDIHRKEQLSRVEDGLSKMSLDDIEYINDVSHGILKNKKKDSNGSQSEFIFD